MFVCSTVRGTIEIYSTAPGERVAWRGVLQFSRPDRTRRSQNALVEPR
jgi:hypothetical protein